MQTSYFIQQIEKLIAQQEFELSLSILRKFTKCASEAHYKQVLGLHRIQKQFLEIAQQSFLSSSEELRYQHATTQSLLEILASLENFLPLTLSIELADIAQHMITSVEHKLIPQARSEEPIHTQAVVQSKLWSPDFPNKPIRLSLISTLAYAAVFLLLGAIAPGMQLLQQHWEDNQELFAEPSIEPELLSELAKRYDLTEIDFPNTHLSFDQSVLAYWQGRVTQGMGVNKLEIAFSSFQQVIIEAQRDKREILTHQDLYMLARSLIDGGLVSQR